MAEPVPDPEAVELLQQLVRNACVNDGSPGSGGEARSAEVIESYLGLGAQEAERFEPLPGRRSLVARIEGSDPDAPTLMYMGHTDVVPVNVDEWDRDPFAGELVDGEVWGRGAIDMLNLTATMAVAFGRLRKSGFRPRGTLVYAAVADEEALSVHGAGWLVDNARDAFGADYVVTESGGIPMPTRSGVRLPVVVGEKGVFWRVIRVHGTAGHASAPLRTDNALVSAAKVVERLAAFRPLAVIGESWRRFVDGMDMPPEVSAMLLDPGRVDELCDVLPDVGLARQAHACTHTTFAPTIMRAGSKVNVIPDVVELEVDVRALVGQGGDDVDAMITEALGDLAERAEVVRMIDDPASESPVETPLWDALAGLAGRFHPGAKLVPFVTPGATDGRFFRRLGAVAYGFGMFSNRLGFEQFSSMFHGANERVDVDSLAMSAELFEHLARDFLG
ncbi:MAG: M20/M25/M40 family metallo-hydrolase [Actinomycetota bacterium]|nr:M20/M25/M40 family metallo-hydrolase [Actinomycetota bacterium]